MIRQPDETQGDPSLMAPLLPPRPNLGPEPWQSASGAGWEWSALLLVLLIVGGVGVFRWWKSRRGRASRPGSIPDPRSADDLGPLEDRRVSRAESLRDALIAAFGPSWGAKTTEEIAEEPDLASKIGPERAGEVVALLAEADRAKFSGGRIAGERSGADDQLDDVLAELISLLRVLKRAPGAEARGLSTAPRRNTIPRSSDPERS